MFGQLFLMAGGTMRHSQICANMIIALGARLRGTNGIVYTSDATVSAEEIDTSVYPDVVVRCGDALGRERRAHLGARPVELRMIDFLLSPLVKAVRSTSPVLR